MEIARRDLLRLGVAAAAMLGASSCSGSRPAEPRSTPARTAPSEPVRTAGVSPRPAFPGQPQRGNLYFGASVPYDRSLHAWEDTLGTTLALNRSYFTPEDGEAEQLVEQCREDLHHDRLPHVSMKPRSTWRDMAAGDADAWLASMLRPLGAESAPVFFTLHHEPENDAGPSGMQPADYVAMQHRVIDLAAELAPNVTVVPVLQHWTFDPLHDEGDPPAWIVEDAAVLGLDLYNPWSPTNGKPWRTFGSKADEVLHWTRGAPLAIGEYGCRVDPENPGRAEEWMHDAAEYARTHDVVSLSYFNSSLNAPDGPWTLTGETERAFAELLASDWVARVG
jgi:hypothetical protein